MIPSTSLMHSDTILDVVIQNRLIISIHFDTRDPPKLNTNDASLYSNTQINRKRNVGVHGNSWNKKKLADRGAQFLD